MKQKVYLAGGFHSDWQERVKDRCRVVHPRTVIQGNFPGGTSSGSTEVVVFDFFEYLDPKIKEFINGERKNLTLEQYTTFDLHYIRQSDIVFVYYEKTNPGVGALIEAGYAKGLGKTVILVLEKDHETIKDRYLDFVKGVSDIYFDNLEEGIEYLYLLK